ncbi:MAG: ribosome biogenesis GTPase Der [Actinomycetota bacterium]|nr:ribosome biogenesis GTPase Der [Actinomycetota bacterium]
MEDYKKNDIPKVAVVGKPNTGKSTLINRICKKREAIVHDSPMITRDRKYYRADWNGRNFYLMDTGGIDSKLKGNINTQVFLQTRKAIHESDVIIFVVDLKQPVSVLDEEIASILRKTDKGIILAGNKCDGKEKDLYAEDYLKFGFDYPVKISALNGINIGDLLDEVIKKFKGNLSSVKENEENEIPGICILGRPNSGKSTLFNAIISDERAIVDEVEGTTRDSINSIVKINGKEYKFIDTAGIKRKKGKVKDLDYYSEIRTLQTIESSDIGLVLVDCSREIANQDVKIVEMCLERGVSVCMVFNKIDLIDNETLESITKMFDLKLKFARYLPFLKVSALGKKGIKDIIEMIDLLVKERSKEVSESSVTNYFKKLDREKEGIYLKGRKFKIKFIRQLKISPPVFLVFTNFNVKRRVNLKRYIENNIRDKFGFEGTPIFFKFKY